MNANVKDLTPKPDNADVPCGLDSCHYRPHTLDRDRSPGMTTKQRISHPEVGEPPAQTWSNCLVVGDQIFIAGLVSRPSEYPEAVDEYHQASTILLKMQKLLHSADAHIDDVVKVVIYVTDIKRREEIWRARREYFSGDFPVSTLIEVSALADPSLKVEIDAIAIRGAGGPRTG